MEEGEQSPPPGVPPEEQNYTELNVSVGTGFMENDLAWGQTLVSYSATNATASVDLTLRNGDGGIVGQNHGSAEDSHAFAFHKGLYASTSIRPAVNCDLHVQATGFGRVWNKAYVNLTLTTWGVKADSDTQFADGKPCPKNESGGPAPPERHSDPSPQGEYMEYHETSGTGGNGVTCELMEAHYADQEGNQTSESWYWWQCS